MFKSIETAHLTLSIFDQNDRMLIATNKKVENTLSLMIRYLGSEFSISEVSSVFSQQIVLSHSRSNLVFILSCLIRVLFSSRVWLHLLQLEKQNKSIDMVKLAGVCKQYALIPYEATKDFTSLIIAIKNAVISESVIQTIGLGLGLSTSEQIELIPKYHIFNQLTFFN